MSEHTNSVSASVEIFGSDRMWGLKEIAMPEPISWWPQTVGWYWLVAILLGVLAWFGWRSLQRYRRNAYRRDGLAMLDRFAGEPALLAELPHLLRKSALSAVPRTEVAGLRGADWIAWLNQSAGSEVFETGDGKFLDALAFSKSGDQIANGVRDRLVEASKIWMRSHRASV